MQPVVQKIKPLDILAKESSKHQLKRGTPPGQYDHNTQTIHVSPETLKQLAALETTFGILPESWLHRDQYA